MIYTTQTSRQVARSRPSDEGTDQWPDISEAPSDQSQPSASCWAGPIPQASHQVRVEKTSRPRDEVGLI